MYRVFLASGSPRRHELLRQLGIEFQPLKVDVDESPRPGETAPDLVRRLGADKAAAGLAALRQSGQDGHAAVIGADTVVVRDGTVLGKPADAAEAERMLASLSGRAHQVMTSMTLCSNDWARTRLSISEVRFRALSMAERAAYVATGEPMDKAGAYGIQGLAGAFVIDLRGSYSGVMGLALHHVDELLGEVGFTGPARSS